MSFITGQKVVCINGKFPIGIEKLYVALPKEGKVYVVRGTTIGVTLSGEEGEICVYLIGINNPRSNVSPNRERGFAEHRFKPLEELTTEEIMSVDTLVGKEVEV